MPPFLALYSFISIQAPMPDNNTLEVVIKPQTATAPALAIKLNASQGQINWKSRPLPPGLYEISYNLPPSFEPVPSQTILLHTGENLILSPQLRPAVKLASVNIAANIPCCHFPFALGQNVPSMARGRARISGGQFATRHLCTRIFHYRARLLYPPR